MGSGRRADSDATEAAGSEEAVAGAVSSHVRDATGEGEDELDDRDKAAARLGTRLAAYQLEELLGVGGTAAVYRAVNAHGETFALKVLHSSLSRDVRARRRFLREAQIAKWLDHPRVVRILATGEAPDGTAYHVMDLHEGVTLERQRAKAPDGLPCDTVIPWMDDLLSVLAVAHARGIIHRDIKPANLLLDPQGRVHVLDFGIMRRAPERGASSLVTRSGALLGTVPFMPPEQALGRSDEIDARTDVWSVGATIFTLITGKLVHRADSVNEALVLAATQSAPPIRKVDPSVPKPLAAVINRALSFDKADRFADAGAMRLALRRACGLEPEPATKEVEAAAGAMRTLPEETLSEGDVRAPAVAGLRRTSPQNVKRILFAAVLLVAAGTVIAWVWTRPPDSAKPIAPAMAEPAPSAAALPPTIAPSAATASAPPAAASPVPVEPPAGAISSSASASARSGTRPPATSSPASIQGTIPRSPSSGAAPKVSAPRPTPSSLSPPTSSLPPF
jgi:serine/threonine-protein kinase